MASAKTAVIEYLFFQNWDQSSQTLKKSVMSKRDVEVAIRHCNSLPGRVRDLSTDNLANFLKDVVRNISAQKNWPASVASLGYTGEQRPGDGNSFEFVPFPNGQSQAFLDPYRPTSTTTRHRIQSLSIPRAAKALGRSDEAWLIQTAVNLRIVEQYMAEASDLDVLDVVHLQMTVKLRKAEIDAIYLATIKTKSGEEKAIITCEAKKYNERILEPQIANQVEQAFSIRTFEVDLVIPIAIRSVKGVGIHVLEFTPVARRNLLSFRPVCLKGEVLYELVPAVRGI